MAVDVVRSLSSEVRQHQKHDNEFNTLTVSYNSEAASTRTAADCSLFSYRVAQNKVAHSIFIFFTTYCTTHTCRKLIEHIDSIYTTNRKKCSTWRHSSAVIEAKRFKNCRIVWPMWSMYVPCFHAPPSIVSDKVCSWTYVGSDNLSSRCS